MSFHSIKIEDEFYAVAKRHAIAEHRSISSQVGYWAKLGKLALENQDLPVTFIKDILLAQHLKEDSEPFEFRAE